MHKRIFRIYKVEFFMILDEHLSQNYDYTVKDQYMGIDLIRNCADVPYAVSYTHLTLPTILLV